MDLNYKPSKAEEVKEDKAVYAMIRGAINEIPTAYSPEIAKYCAPKFDQKTVSFHLGKMISRGEVRQREDEMEHDWEYVKGRNW